MAADRSLKVAALLSALLPGLGQFYNRQWAKGAGFLVTTLLLDAGLGVTSETLSVFQSVLSGSGGNDVNVSSFVLRMLPLAAIAMWSMTDAARAAKASPGSPYPL
jgi:TM2 domain-containing membrane protein YozV